MGPEQRLAGGRWAEGRVGRTGHVLEKGGGKQGSVPCLVSSMQSRYGLQVVQQGPEVKLC